LAPIAFASFSDLDRNNDQDAVYVSEIEFLAGKGIVQGYEDGTYRPVYKINRAEFLKIILTTARVYDLISDEIVGKNCFKDVHEEWFSQYICYAKDKGFISGYPDGNFMPAQNVNFVEASKIVAMILQIEVKAEYKESWFQKYTQSLAEIDVIPRSIVTFNQEINRGEMALLISNVLTKKYVNVSDFSVDSLNYAEMSKLTGINCKSDIQRLSYKGEGNNKFFNCGKDLYVLYFGMLTEVGEVDLASFTFVSESLYKDNKYLYFIDTTSGKVAKSANFDVTSFEYLTGNLAGEFALSPTFSFFKDKNGLYANAFGFDLDHMNKIESFHQNYFAIVGIDRNAVLFKDDTSIYIAKLMNSYIYDEKDVVYQKLEDVDYGTFVFLGSSLFKDQKNIYSFGSKRYPMKDNPDFYYTKSDEVINVLTGIDAKTTEIINEAVFPIYLRDKNAVYVADGTNFTKLDIISDPASLEVVEVYDMTYVFEPLALSYYLKDKFHIYVLDPVAKEFVMLSDNVATFNYKKYLESKNVEITREIG